ncbi:SDR family oxidoreductase [soil metagenome]
MTTIGITGSTGQLGRLILERLRAEPIPEATLRLIVRDAARAPQLLDAWGAPAEVRVAEYADAAAARAALDGVDTLFMASGSESPTRREEHRTFIAAAAASGVSHLIYTSFVGATPDAVFTLGRDHADAESAIREAAAQRADGTAGMTFTVLRDNFYSDFVPMFAGEDGVIRGPAGAGRFAAVARADVADVVVAVLRDRAGGSGSEDAAAHADTTYSLTGPEALTMAEAAERAGAASGRELRYREETPDEAYASRRQWSTQQWQLDAWVSTYTAIRDGEVAEVTGDVERLTGHPARTIEQAIADNPGV